MGIQYPKPVQNEIGRHHHDLKRHDEQNQIKKEEELLKAEFVPGKGPGRRHSNKQLSGQYTENLQAGIPEHHKKAGRSKKQIGIWLQRRKVREQGREHRLFSQIQNRQVPPHQLILRHKGCRRH